MTDGPFDLARFLAAQAPVLEVVLEELRAGEKQAHWMWFVFPQLAGLGESPMARRYALHSLEEARAYLFHPVLGPRLCECTRLVLRQAPRPITDVFAFPDSAKFHSSMTLFLRASTPGSIFRRALDVFFDGRPDPATLARLPAP